MHVHMNMHVQTRKQKKDITHEKLAEHMYFTQEPIPRIMS